MALIRPKVTSSSGSPSALDQRLLEAIQGGNCVAFVGAGFSAAAGYPHWKQLIIRLAEEAPADQHAEV